MWWRTTAALIGRDRRPSASSSSIVSEASGPPIGSSWTSGSSRSVRRSRRTTRSASRVWTVSSHARIARGSRIVGAARSARSNVVWTRSSASASSRAIARAAARSNGPSTLSAATHSGVGALTAARESRANAARSSWSTSSGSVMTLTSLKRLRHTETGIYSRQSAAKLWPPPLAVGHSSGFAGRMSKAPLVSPGEWYGHSYGAFGLPIWARETRRGGSHARRRPHNRGSWANRPPDSPYHRWGQSAGEIGPPASLVGVTSSALLAACGLARRSRPR